MESESIFLFMAESEPESIFFIFGGVREPESILYDSAALIITMDCRIEWTKNSKKIDLMNDIPWLNKKNWIECNWLSSHLKFKNK